MIFGGTNLMGLARNSYVNLSVINIKLPPYIAEDVASVPGSAVGFGNDNYSGTNNIQLEKVTSQTEFFVEGQMLVPKNKAVVYSNEVIFFYVDRRDRMPSFLGGNGVGYSNVVMPVSLGSIVVINETNLEFKDVMKIGRDSFEIRSIVLIESPINMPNIITGLSTSIVVEPNTFGSKSSYSYLNYNPVLAALKFEDGSGGYRQNTPFTNIPERSINGTMSFKDSAYKRGSIFLYTKVPTDNQFY